MAAPLILLVDDDRDFLDIHRRLLEGAGYRVACCAAPDEAVACAARERPDLVITDLMMRAIDDGFALVRRLKRETAPAPLPIIVMTAVGSRLGYDFSPRSPAELAAMGADGFFDKPADPACLLAKVRDLLAREPPGPVPGARGD